MFLLKTSLFNPIDLLAFPLALIVLYLASKIMLRNEDNETKAFFLQAFWVRVLMLLIFTAVMQYYYGGGDSFRYYISILDIRSALNDRAISLWDLITTSKADSFHPLYNYFSYDELGENHYYMMRAPNFAVPKIGTFFSFIFFNSYLAIGFCFSYFALLGSMGIYKVFAREFPRMKNQIALACFFFPTVCFWSSGLLKDSLTFGALGFLFSAVYNVLVLHKNFTASIIKTIIAVYILYIIKPYIMLAFIPGLLLLIFTRWTDKVESRQLKRLAFALMMIIGLLGGVFLYMNLTSEGALGQYRAEVIFDAIDRQRNVFETANVSDRSGSNFDLGSDNPVLTFPLGIVASYFRPFLWEIRNPVMALSALESLLCSLLVIFLFVKVGFFRTLRIALGNPFTIFCLVFSLLFGGAVGTSTGNFGSLVRYKIPGLPFFLLLILITLHLANVSLPARVRKIKLFQTT
ncbi:MAG TPA: hypothetical protein VHN59_03720 [Chitinophagaceae bacterium]|nr:hypothetical protein [Chitinophagaceae bacterium]